MGVAAGLDQAIQAQEIRTRANFDIASLWWLMSLSKLLLMSLCVLLFWLVHRARSNRPVMLLFVFVGAVLLFYNVVAQSVGFLEMTFALLPSNLLVTAGAFIAATGLFHLLLPWRDE